MSVSVVRGVAVPAALALLLAATACTDDDSDAAQAVAEDDHVAVGVADGVAPETPTPDEGERPGWLVGPSYSIGVVGYTVSETAPDDVAGAYGFESGPVDAPEGHEFFMAVIDEESRVADQPSAVLSVDGEDTELEQLPESGQTLAAVIPTGASVELTVTDKERTQTLDLREGARTTEIASFYNAEGESSDPKDYSSKASATGDAGSDYVPETRELSIEMTVDPALRSPWHAEHGWADEGEVWITVPVKDIRTDSVWGFEKGSTEPIMTWKLEQKDLFTLELGDDESVEAEGKQKFVANDEQSPVDGDKSSFDPSAAELVFAVPEDTAEATLHIKPRGTLKAEWENVEGDVSWDDEPKTGKIELEF
ncbi:MAG: hypothetical protein ACRDXX_07995 [Stackebrandtia sp.]